MLKAHVTDGVRKGWQIVDKDHRAARSLLRCPHARVWRSRQAHALGSRSCLGGSSAESLLEGYLPQQGPAAIQPIITETITAPVSNIVPLGRELPAQGGEAQADAQPVAAREAVKGPWELIAFTLPTLGIWLINPVLSMIDTSVVGTRSATELAALGPGTTLCDSTAYIFTFLAVATTNMLAISLAKKDKKETESTLSEALGIAAVLGISLGLVVFTSAPALLKRMTGAASAAAVAPALTYVRIRCWGLPAALLTFVAQAFYLAARDPWTPLQAAVLAGLTNLVGDLILCCVFDLGIGGAAWATAFAQITTAGYLLLALKRPMRHSSLLPAFLVHFRWCLPSLTSIKRFRKFAGPIMGVLTTKVVMYGALSTVATGLGETYAAAHHVMITIYMLFAPMGDAVSQAAQTFLPTAVGHPEAAAGLGRQLMTTGVIVGAVNCFTASLVVLALPGLLTNSAVVQQVMAGITPVFCLALLVHTASMATEGMLLAGQDLVYMMTSYVVNLLLTLASVWAAMASQKPMSLAAVWFCLLQFQGTRLVFNSVRLSQRSSPLRTERPLKGMMGAAI